MSFLRWYWFHCKRAYGLHEGRANFFKQRTFKERMLAVLSFGILLAGFNLFMMALTLLAVAFYLAFPNAP